MKRHQPLSLPMLLGICIGLTARRIDGQKMGGPRMPPHDYTANLAGSTKTEGASDGSPFSTSEIRLGIDSTLADCVRHAVDRQHISRDPVVDTVRFGVPHNI